MRYDKARQDNRRSYRYTLRLRLASFEGVRNMFYQYASLQAGELEALLARHHALPRTTRGEDVLPVARGPHGIDRAGPRRGRGARHPSSPTARRPGG